MGGDRNPVGAHDHHDHRHTHADHGLGAGFVLVTAYAFVELAGGWWSDSLALLGDAGHMFSDAVALGLAFLAARIARRPPSTRHSYGLARSEVLAALVNGSLMLAITALIAWQAIDRLVFTPAVVTGGIVSANALGEVFAAPPPDLILEAIRSAAPGTTIFGVLSAVALVGLVVNIVVVRMLHGGEQSLNRRAAMLHVLSDLFASIAALLSGVVIQATGWMAIDPILSLFICALILASSLRLLREVVQVILEGVPPGIDLPEVGRCLAAIDGVESVHDLHIWALSTGRPVLTAHVVVDDLAGWSRLLPRLRRRLVDDYGIDHVTLQPETAGDEAVVVWHRNGGVGEPDNGGGGTAPGQ